MYTLYDILDDDIDLVTDAILFLGGCKQSRARVFRKVATLNITLNKFIKHISIKDLNDFKISHNPKRKQYDYIPDTKREIEEIEDKIPDYKLRYNNGLYYAYNDEEEIEITKQTFQALGGCNLWQS